MKIKAWAVLSPGGRVILAMESKMDVITWADGTCYTVGPVTIVKGHDDEVDTSQECVDKTQKNRHMPETLVTNDLPENKE